MMKPLLKSPFHAGPKTEGYLLSAMNLWNTPLSLWGLSQVSIPEDAEVLDIGCGGGKNLMRLLEKAPKGHVSGIDSSFRAVDLPTVSMRRPSGKGAARCMRDPPMCCLLMKINLISSWRKKLLFLEGSCRLPEGGSPGIKARRHFPHPPVQGRQSSSPGL